MFAASKSGSVDAKDPQFNYVTMLLHGDGTNGAQNNTFLDSSTNAFSITRNGNTTQGTFTPYGANWSNYFDGSGDRLTVPANAAFNFSTGDFTVECWFYTNSVSANQWIVGPDNTVTYPWVLQTSGSTIRFLSNNAANIFSPTSFTLTVGTWNHFAVTRSGSTMYWFTNGTLNGTQTYSTAIGSNTIDVQIGTTGSGSGDPVNGYISNLRVVKGTAVYTSSFTPSTTPLTAITNTSLLTCQSNRFIDNSSNAFTITKYNDVSVQRFSPFSPTSAYSTSVIGGSGYFDGSGDYLKAPDNAAFSMSTNPFTVECWVYVTTAASAGQSIISQWISGNDSNSSWMLGFNWGGGSGGNKFEGTISIGGSVTSITDTSNYSLNTWYHLVLSRSGSPGTLALFVNGTRVASTSITGSIVDATNSVGIGIRGGGTDYPFPGGYISNVRVVNGTDVYGSTNTTLTIPTAPLTAVTNTSLLLNYTNAGILDNAMMNDLETVGNAQISTSVKKYGTGSLAFDGTGDYLTTYDPSYKLSVGSGDFTFESWVYVNSLPATVTALYHLKNDAALATTVFILELTPAGAISLSTGAALIASGTNGKITTGSWIHFAFVRTSGVFKTFFNGVQDISTANTTTYNGTYLQIGAWRYSGYDFSLNGYIDDLRITKGVARYTANFTAPTTAFADKG